MKTISKLFLLSLGVLMVFTSCIDEGEETFVLEKGDINSLIQSSWKVSESYLYDPNTFEYHSDFINDPQLGYIYVLDSERVSAEIAPDGSPILLTWSVDESNNTLSLNNNRYKIESIGKQLMVISRYIDLNDNHYLQKYYLRNIGEVEDLDNIEDPDENATYVVSSDNYGTFRRNGYSFTIPVGSVPKGDNGQVGSVAFSAQSVDYSELPAELPEGIDYINGSAILANPINFIFASPIVIDVPLRGNTISNTCLYHWNGIKRKWEVVPYSSSNSNSTARVSVIELGYFALGVKHSSEQLGGIKIKKSALSNEYIYYLTLTPTNGDNESSIAFGSGGNDLYIANVPLQSYNVLLTREKRTDLGSGATSIETSSISLDVTVSNPLVPKGSNLSSYNGWTIIDLSSIEWEDGRPSLWGEETVTYGTGTFQATLNWINYSGSTTDYDLHLTTPNGNEIYYSRKRGDGFELDRDMTSQVGNCVENLYSISNTLPAGTYKVRVYHYSGATGREYSCRIILNGRVVTMYSGITNSGYQDIYTFTLQ